MSDTVLDTRDTAMNKMHKKIYLPTWRLDSLGEQKPLKICQMV